MINAIVWSSLFSLPRLHNHDLQERGEWLAFSIMGVTGLWDVSKSARLRGPSDTTQILRPSGELRSLTHIAIVDGFEDNPANLRGLCIGIDASIWFFHATHGREGENPELRTLFFRCAKLVSVPFLPLFIFDGPKRPKFKHGRRISGEKHWLVDSMKGIIKAFGFEWRMVRSSLFIIVDQSADCFVGPWRGRS